MVYILDKYISPRKTTKNALMNVYGVGPKRALAICSAIGISPEGRLCSITPLLLTRLSKQITSDYIVGVSLKKKIYSDILLLKKMRHRRGIRHQNNLPARGQRTHTNAQTRKR